MSMEVEAFIFDKKIGNLLLKDGIVYFEYDKNFKTSGLEISPLKLPLSQSGVYTNNDERYFEGLAGVFHDTLPDKFGTKVIERYFESKNISPHQLSVLQKLMFVGDKSIGAITYKPVIHKIEEKTVNELIELQNFYENAKKIISGDAIEVVDEMLNFMDSAASAGGARAKAIIGYNEDTKEIISGVKRDLKENFEHYLIKFDIANDDGTSSDYTKLEYLYMGMAKEVGIDVPKIELLEHGNLAHYLIKRFDRINGEALHLHSVAGLTHTNFNIPMHYSYDELLRLTRYLTGSQKAVNEQFQRMIFNLVGRNQDDHAKNFAFTMDKNGIWNLSPAYDITYSNGAGYTKNHQLSLNGKTNDFTLKDILGLAKKHSIKENVAKEYLEQIVEVFSGFKNRAGELDIRGKTIQRIGNELRLILN
ncbi:HipA domain-containing protein [Aliarcobacter cryaerophilus]|uniref:type II toxin-antitoxin system HipA family toxin n=1 Tax=Aliarcobacter cryaerophilus TaxID=28198 RepID=UPI0021B5D355|nr:HipA domain-containing protein [Aliarcobacter cryaerophilus]MCT7487061.1 HipA domain-containing protein [Aliarcobacter cryaerophilus]MCT7491625.1 HipA domain-containing protein [Aliarcobacter cryaerophilus]